MTTKETSNQNINCNICQSHFDVPENEFINHFKAHSTSITTSENLFQNTTKLQNTPELQCDICDQKCASKSTTQVFLMCKLKMLN